MNESEGQVPAPRRRSWLRMFVWSLAIVAAAILAGGQMGLFSGSRPDALGFNAGKFAPCAWKPNCVSSTTDAKADAGHYIEALKFDGDAQAAWSRLVALVKAAPRAAIVREDAAYLYAEFSSRTMGFTDDVEFALDAANQRIHVRSASRLGVRDFGVNRARIEDIRARFGAAR